MGHTGALAGGDVGEIGDSGDDRPLLLDDKGDIYIDGGEGKPYEELHADADASEYTDDRGLANSGANDVAAVGA